MYLRTLFCIIFLTFFNIESHAQYEWFDTYEGNAFVTLTKMTIDNSNKQDLYVLANFAEDITIKGEVATGPGSALIKYSNSGEVLWYKIFRYSREVNSLQSGSVETDGQGNVYVANGYPQSATIDGNTISGQFFNTFVAKFDSDGDLIWLKTFIYQQEVFFRLSVNLKGDVGIAGILQSELQIGDTTLSVTHFNTYGALFDTDGVVQWAQIFGLDLDDKAFTNYPISITLDNAGNYFICGRYTGQVEVGDKQVTDPGTGTYNVYYAKINTQGKCEWLTEVYRNASASFEENNNPPFFVVTELGDLTTDGTGNLYACGTFMSDIKIDTYEFYSDVADPHNNNFYIAKFDTSGKIQWLKPTFNVNGGNTTENIISLNDKVFISGMYSNATITNAPYYKILDASGETLKEQTYFPLNSDTGPGFAVDEAEAIYMSGRYYMDDEFHFKGYIFKPGIPGPPDPAIADASTVTANMTCISETIIATTGSIENATQYIWEIAYSGKTRTIRTDFPIVKIPRDDLDNASDISIRVRGANAKGVGNFSASSTVNTIEKKIDQSSLFIPNIITPNNDDVNEHFVLDAQLAGSRLVMMSRWGNEYIVPIIIKMIGQVVLSHLVFTFT